MAASRKSCSSFRSMRKLLLWLVLASLHAATESAVVTLNGNAIKKATSFVTPTFGSPHSLTLSTYLTDAADLHYAVVLSGHAPLDAAAIKNAAEQCSAPLSPSSSSQSATEPASRRSSPSQQAANEQRDRLQLSEAVSANTVTVAKAQKVERRVSGLQPNTSYDVYFVAEVSGSNGVFGSVQSVLHSTTHPEPPVIMITSLVPANDSATTLEVNATMSTPGRVYFAFVPSSAERKSEQELSVADIVSNRSFSSELPSVFALHDQDDWTQSSFFKVVQGLTSATLYDVLLVAEALGDGGVRSAVVHLSGAARTHVLPPDVVRLVVSPQNASAEALVVDFDLRFDSQDVLRASMENLRFFTFNIHYEATRLEDSSPEGSFQPAAPAESTGDNPQAAIVSKSTDVVRGVFSFGNFSSVEQFQEQLTTTQRGVIPGLLNGTKYRVTLAAETSSSHGLVGKQQSATACKTHEQAPRILAASAKAVNGSVNMLVVTTEMERCGGNVHYLVAERNVVLSIRNHLHDAKSMTHLVELVRGGRGNNAEVFSGKIEFDPNLCAINASSNSYTTVLQVDGLRDATAYAIVVIPETHRSYGVFGKPFEQLLEAQTNENASQVTLHAVEPVFGSTSSVELFAEMTKPNDVLYYCLSTTGDTTAVNLNIEQRDLCFEANRTTFQFSRGVSSPPSFSGFSFTVGNLTEDTLYFVSIFAENVARNQVFSAATAPQLEVKTHKRAPALLRTDAKPVTASTDRIATTAAVSETCLVHYAIIETPVDEAPLSSIEDLETGVKNDTFPSPEAIIKEKWMFVPSSSSDQHQRVQFVSQGHVFAANNALESFSTASLKANTSYTLFLTTETSLSGNTSGVYGDVQKVSVTTFATAPKIIKATVDPVADHTDSVFIAANLSTPGVVHYFLSDVDFADPAVIRKAVHGDGDGDGADIEDDSNSVVSSAPHTLRGQFYVYAQDMAMEIINGTNDSRPVEPLMFVNNLTVGGLKSGATYHVSLTTETFESDGVFGDFPPPILVTTHLPAPKILPPLQGGGSVVRPKPGSSSTLAIELELSRFGEVHYALFFRSLVPDRSDAVFEKNRLAELEALEASQKEAQSSAAALNETNATEPTHVWPPLSSEYNLANLNASLLKAAHFEDLGAGVWENGTISVSREDVLKGKLTVKEISKLPPNAIFDVCLVSETAGSDGIFDWENASKACHRVQTHADYSNQSVLFDEITVRPIDGMTGSIRIDLAMSKLLDAPTDTTGEHLSILERFAVAAGRTPYFILADGKEARREFAYNSFSSSSNSRSRDKAASFKDAVPGTNGVAAGGILTQIGSENATFLVLTQEIHELKPNHPYFLFFAYETSDSDGVFTKINPHKHRSNDSKTESDAIEVVTHETAPVLTKFAAVPTFGNTSTVTIQFDIACASCKESIVHVLVYPEVCARPSIELLKAQQSGGGQRDDVSSIPRDSDGGKEICGRPLATRRFVVEMNEREHKMTNVDRDITIDQDGEGEAGSPSDLQPNTTYKVFLATETAHSSGVLSDRFIETSVTTFALAPVFKYVRVLPRKGSTTELLLEFELERPGEVHFMCGISGNPELNVTSPYNVSRRGRPEKNAPKVHDYARDVVRLHRSVKIERSGEKHIEVLDYLVAGTTYDVFVVAETIENNGIYGDVLEFPQVSTHANPPILLAHAAYPTPGSMTSLTVGFRVDAPGSVHFSIVEVDVWSQTKHVARGSDFYGNRLAIQERLVGQESLVIDSESMSSQANSGSRDSGWREVNISVPRPGTNYTVYLVTETTGSDGVFGTVASHRDVRSHSEPPTALKLSVTPADARVDALAASIQLTDAGHVHYVVLPHRRRLSERHEATVAQGVVDVVDSAKTGLGPAKRGAGGENVVVDGLFDATFVIEQLKEGTVYDIYFRCETLSSFGVFGSWTHFPISARTHGLPPDVLEEVECAVTPSCDVIGRETCMRTPNVCGECLEGFSGMVGSSNEPCNKVEGLLHQNMKKKGATIKISGVRVNPLAWLEWEQQPQQQQPEVEAAKPELGPPLQTELEKQQQQPLGAESQQPELETEQPLAGNNQTALPEQPASEVLTPSEPDTESESELESQFVQLVDDDEEEEVEVELPAAMASTTILPQEEEMLKSSTDPLTISDGLTTTTGVTACPMHAHMVVPGQCECMRGYEFNPESNLCELPVEIAASPSDSTVLESPSHHAESSRSI